MILLYIYIYLYYILASVQHNGDVSLENQNAMIFLSSYTQMLGEKKLTLPQDRFLTNLFQLTIQ